MITDHAVVTLPQSRGRFPLLPLREKVPEGRMRGSASSINIKAWDDAEPLTRFSRYARKNHPLPQGERVGNTMSPSANQPRKDH
jgi:hypothetical protein